MAGAREEGKTGSLVSLILTDANAWCNGTVCRCSPARLLGGIYRRLFSLADVPSTEVPSTEVPRASQPMCDPDPRAGISRPQGCCFQKPAPHLIGVTSGRPATRQRRDSRDTGYLQRTQCLGGRLGRSPGGGLFGPLCFGHDPGKRKDCGNAWPCQ